MDQTLQEKPPHREAPRAAGGGGLCVQDVHKSYPTPAEPLVVLRGVSLSLTPGGSLAIVGPSGSGKSTLLNVIGTLDRPTSGTVTLDGIDPFTLSADELARFRSGHVGFVFQDHHLLPQCRAVENVLLPKLAAGTVAGEDTNRAAELLRQVGLEGRANHLPSEMSGGERQRVAVARALAPRPRVLLMDEPFSSLDGRLRDHVRQQTLDILRDTQTTTIVVTHEPDEALRMADRIVLLREGRLEQVGSPQELYSRPATMFAARFFSDVNELPGTYRDGRVETPLGTFAAPAQVGAAARVCIRPEHLRIATSPTSVPARVLRSEFRGEIDHVVLSVDGLPTPLTLRAFGRTSLAAGDAIHLEVPVENVLVVPHDH